MTTFDWCVPPPTWANQRLPCSKWRGLRGLHPVLVIPDESSLAVHVPKNYMFECSKERNDIRNTERSGSVTQLINLVQSALPDVSASFNANPSERSVTFHYICSVLNVCTLWQTYSWHLYIGALTLSGNNEHATSWTWVWQCNLLVSECYSKEKERFEITEKSIEISLKCFHAKHTCKYDASIAANRPTKLFLSLETSVNLGASICQ